MRKLLLTLLTAVCACAGQPSWAASFPERPVKIVVPFPAGAAADAAMRVIGRKLSEIWGQPVIVDNRPGIPGVLGVVTANPDGYNLLLGAGSLIVTSPLTNKRITYQPQRDLVPIGSMITNTGIMVATPSLQVKDVKSLVALAKAKPGTLNYSSPGMGSPPHLAMELFEQITGTKMVHIAYKGAAPAVVDLISGNVQLGINALPSVLQHIKSGKLIPLAVITETRDKNLPDIPTMKEAGIEHFDYPVWYGLFAPAATPKELVEKINADLQRALNDPDVVKQLDGQGAYAAPSSQKAFTAAIAKDIAAWSKLIKERNLQLEE